MGSTSRPKSAEVKAGDHTWQRNPRADVPDFAESWTCCKCHRARLVDVGSRPKPDEAFPYDANMALTFKSCDERMVERMMEE
jgi:hypothetical protein